MDRGALQATVHRVTELDMTEQLTHIHLFPDDERLGCFCFLAAENLSCREHSCTCFSVDICLHFSWADS